MVVYLKNEVLLTYTLEGVNSIANFTTVYEVTQYNRDSHFLIRTMVFVFRGNLFNFYYSM